MSSAKGFTLIELLVVISIMSLTVALVGGLSVANYQKYEVYSERKQMQSLIADISATAFAKESAYELQVRENQLRITNISSKRTETTFLQHLQFKPGNVVFNRFGYPSNNTLEYRVGDKNYTIAIGFYKENE